MAIPETRADFKEYCLRALGKPVLQINVDDTQVEDRIDEAFYMYQQFHMDAVTKTWMKHEVTASVMTFEANTQVGTFRTGENIKGATSNATGVITDANGGGSFIKFFAGGSHIGSSSNAASYDDTAYVPGFIPSEVIVGTLSNATATFASLVLGDCDLRWLPIPDAVIAITKVLPVYDSRIGADILFDPTSQFNMSLMSNFTSNSIIPYFIGRTYQQMINDLFRGRPGIRFERHMNRLYIDVNWTTAIAPGQHWMIEGYRVIDPDAFPDVYGDRWLQKYAQSLIKRQWAMNMGKFGGIALPGGVTLNARDMMNDAKEEIDALEKALQTEYQLPIDFVVG